MATLKGGESLAQNQEIRSDNGAYRLVMQTDGNLVGYPTAGGPAFWATDTWNRPVLDRPVRADMQHDGNFVLYDALSRPVWASGTDNNPGAYLAVQDDRNLVVYASDGRPLWASMTNIPAPERRTGVVESRRDDEVGWGKRMETTARLYRDGRLVVDSYTKNDNWTGGLRGRTLVVVVDSQNRAISVSDIFADPTRCSVPDFSCASYGRTTFQQMFPVAIGQYAERLDIYHADNANFVDLRERTIEVIRGITGVAQEVIDAIKQLYG